MEHVSPHGQGLPEPPRPQACNDQFGPFWGRIPHFPAAPWALCIPLPHIRPLGSHPGPSVPLSSGKDNAQGHGNTVLSLPTPGPRPWPQRIAQVTPHRGTSVPLPQHRALGDGDRDSCSDPRVPHLPPKQWRFHGAWGVTQKITILMKCPLKTTAVSATSYSCWDRVNPEAWQ